MFAKPRWFATFLFAALLIVGLASSLHAATVANALDFDGVNDSVTITGFATLTNAPLGDSARTVEAWVKTTSTTDTKVFAYGGAALYQRFSLGINNGSIGVEANDSEVIWTSTVNDGLWHHLAVVYPGSGGIAAASVYVDGVLLTTMSTNWHGSFALATTTGAAFIGSLGGTSFFLAGTIDELRVWNVARTQAQIVAAKGAELTGTEAGLVAYYPFNQGVAGGTNTADNGGGMSNDTNSNPKLTNVTFRSNSAGYGGGMYNNKSYSTLTNVTISGNRAAVGGGGGGVYNVKGTITLINSLVDGNTARTNTSSHQTYGTVTATTSWLSPNDTSAAQVKLDANGKPTAPTGLQIGTTCPATDLVGTKRGTTCTVGAYEFTGKLASSTKAAALQAAATLASENLTWDTAAGTVTLDLPTGAITQPTWLFYDPAVATAPALTQFSLSAASDGTFQPLPDFAFTTPVTLTIPTTATEALELRRYDAASGVWTTAGITAAGQTATSLSFALTQMGQYGLFPVPTSVWIEAQASSPVGLQAIPGGTQVTYQVTQHNAGQASASGVVVSDTLPLGVTFANWLTQDTATFDGTWINWQPADIAAGGSATISFTVHTSNAAPYLGQSIVNTAAYSLGDTSASAQVSFSLNGPPSVSDISMTTPANTALTIAPLLLGITNADGSPITLSIGTPQHGSATLVGSTIIYTPTTDFLGNDTFTYTVQDASFQVSAAVQVRVANLAFPFIGQTVGTNPIMPGQTLTYMLSLSNGAEQALQQGTITVTLPISLTFGTWLTQDTATITGRTITWGPSDLGLNTSKAISFTVVVNRAAEGTLLANTAHLTATNADPTSDTFTLNVLVPLRTYLPVVVR